MNSILRRRRALMGGKVTPDTTAQIMQDNVRWASTTTNKEKKDADPNWCITIKYDIPAGTPTGGTTNRISANLGSNSNVPYAKYVLYKNGSDTPFDYWVMSQPRITEGAEQISFSVLKSIMDDAYAYIIQTGHIFFAGKNTPYYGKQNIND